MELRPRHWAIALVGAIALHASALVLFWQPSSAETAVAAGLGGVEVSLGPAGAPSGSMTASSDVEMVEPVTAETSQATPVTPEEVPTEVAEVETPVEAVEPVEPEPPVEAVEPIEPEPVETAGPVEPVTPVEVAEVPAQEPEPVEEVELAEVVPLPEPPPAKPEPPWQVAEAPAPPPAAPAPAAAEPAEQPAPAPTAEEPGEAGKSGDTQLSAAGTGATTSGGVPGAISDDYAALLSSWIDKNHEFPERLSRRKLYGQAVVSFTIDRGGNLLTYAIVRSSGHERLDAAAIATLKRSSPMPAMPPELPGTQYTGQIPIGFDPPS